MANTVPLPEWVTSHILPKDLEDAKARVAATRETVENIHNFLCHCNTPADTMAVVTDLVNLTRALQSTLNAFASMEVRAADLVESAAEITDSLRSKIQYIITLWLEFADLFQGRLAALQALDRSMAE